MAGERLTGSGRRRDRRRYITPILTSGLFLTTAATAILLSSNGNTPDQPSCIGNSVAEPFAGSTKIVNSSKAYVDHEPNYFEENVQIENPGQTIDVTSGKPTPIIETVANGKVIRLCAYPGRIYDALYGKSKSLPVYVAQNIIEQVIGGTVTNQLTEVHGADTETAGPFGYQNVLVIFNAKTGLNQSGKAA